MASVLGTRFGNRRLVVRIHFSPFIGQIGDYMRLLTKVEVDEALDGNGEAGESMIPVETTVGELAELNASCACGGVPFQEAVDKGYGKRKVRGWFGIDRTLVEFGQPEPNELDYSVNKPIMMGMIHIKIQTEKTAEKVGEILGIRFEGESGWDGFMTFEDE